MESLQTATQMLSLNSCLASIDLKDAYYCISIAKEQQKYLKFQWNNKLYKFIYGPRVFCKLLKPVFAKLRQKGHQSVIYIDDSYLQSNDEENCKENIVNTVNLLAF